jgi:hypothetical protein
MSDEKQKNRVQVYNPRTKKWVKLNTKEGGIVSVKKSPGPYQDVRHYRKKR